MIFTFVLVSVSLVKQISVQKPTIQIFDPENYIGQLDPRPN